MSKDKLARKGVYTIRDCKACFIGPLFTANSNDEAVRSFSDLVIGSKESLLTRHPEDFMLLYIGDIDEETGVISGLSSPTVLCSGSDFRKE